MIHPRTTIALLLATTPVRAQEPTLPRLLQLGPLPAAPTSTLHLAPGRPSAEAAIPDDTPHVVLRCHPSTSIAQLTAVLQSLHEHRVAEVYFAATCPMAQKVASASLFRIRPSRLPR